MNLQQLLGRVNEQPDDPKTPPRALFLSLWALAGAGLFLIVSALLRFGFTAEISKQLVDANNNAKTPKKPYGPTQITHDLHSLRVFGLLEGVIFAAVLGVIGWQLIQGKGFMRWLLLGIAVLTRLPLYVLLVGGNGSVLIRLSAFLTGLSYIVALLLIFVPRPARNFFLAHRRPMAAGGAGGLGGPGAIFGPKRTAGSAPRSTSGAVSLDKPSSIGAAGANSASGNANAASGKANAARSKSKSRITDATEAPASRPGGRGKSRGR